MDQNSAEISIHYHGNYREKEEYLAWDDEISGQPRADDSAGSAPTITATAIAQNSNVANKFTVEDFEEFNLDNSDELTEEEKEILFRYIESLQEEEYQVQPPEYDCFNSERFLDTIYEEDSDDLRSWDSDEGDIPRISPYSDDHYDPAAISRSYNKRGKESDKDSSYDSDFSTVNSIECLEGVGASTLGGETTYEVKECLLYGENDIEDVLDQSAVTSLSLASEPVWDNLNQDRDTSGHLVTPSKVKCGGNETFLIQSDELIDIIKSDFNNDDLCCESSSNDNSAIIHGSVTLGESENNYGAESTACEVIDQRDVDEGAAVGIDRLITGLFPDDVDAGPSDGKVSPSIVDKCNSDSNSPNGRSGKNCDILDDVVVTSCLPFDKNERRVMVMEDGVDVENNMEKVCDGVSENHECNFEQVKIINNLHENKSRASKVVNPFNYLAMAAKKCSNNAKNGINDDRPSQSASEELYSMLPKVGDLPEIKDICYSWFSETNSSEIMLDSGQLYDSPQSNNRYKFIENTANIASSKIEIDAQKVESDRNSISPESSRDWEKWLDHSLDERSGRDTDFSENLNDYNQEQSNLSDPSDSSYRNVNEHQIPDEINKFNLEYVEIPERSVLTLPRNYESAAQNFSGFDIEEFEDYSVKRGPQLADYQGEEDNLCTRGNNGSRATLGHVGVSSESPSRLVGSSEFKLDNLRQRSKSTPDLSCRGGRREETLVRKIGHTSQVKLEVCELSPGLQYKTHCVIVDESVSAKTAKFESLANNSSSNIAYKNRSSRFSCSPEVISNKNNGVYLVPEAVDEKESVCNLIQEESDAHLDVINHSLEFDGEENSEESFSESLNSSLAEQKVEQECYDNDSNMIEQQTNSVNEFVINELSMTSYDIGMKQHEITARFPVVEEPVADKTAQVQQKTDVSKLVAMFENEIKKSEPRHCSTTLVVKGGERSRSVTSRSPTADGTTSNKNIVNVTPERFNKITGLQSGIRATASKPPLPPVLQEKLQQDNHQSSLQITPTTFKYLHARKHFLRNEDKPNGDVSGEHSDSELEGETRLVRLTSDRLSKFQRSTHAERARLAKSVPDLVGAADKVFANSIKSSGDQKPCLDDFKKSEKQHHQKSRLRRRLELSKSRNEDEWDTLLTAAAVHYGKRYDQAKQQSSDVKKDLSLSKSHGYLETNLDTLECRQVDQTDLDDVFSDSQTVLPSAGGSGRSRAKSLMSLGVNNIEIAANSDCSSVDGSRAKSMEFLLDEDNKAAVVAPENQLMRESRVPSEHELRFQKSLKNLTLPNWYRDSVNIQSKKSDENISDSGGGAVTTRWQGISSRSSSSSSLNAVKTPSINKPIVVPKRVTADWRYVKYGINSSKESLTTRTPSTEPESPNEDSSFCHPTFSRWNSARMSGTSTGSFGGASSIYRSFRQPYMGWRSSVERLSTTSGQPSNSSSQCPSPSSSAASSFRFPEKSSIGVGLSRWGNLGTMNVSYVTDTESDLDVNSRPSSAMAATTNLFCGQYDDGNKLSWKPSTIENQQVDSNSKAGNGDMNENMRPNGHCETKELSPAQNLWMESSFVGRRNDKKSIQTSRTEFQSSAGEGAPSQDPSERPQGEYYAMLRHQHKNLLCT